MGRVLKKLGFSHISARPRHPVQDPEAIATFKKLSHAGRGDPDQTTPETPIEVWFQDEMRVGQNNSLLYRWAKKGSRPRQSKDQRYENAYVFGAVCASRDTGVALIMPQADTPAMQAHLDAIGRSITAGRPVPRGNQSDSAVERQSG